MSAVLEDMTTTVATTKQARRMAEAAENKKANVVDDMGPHSLL